MVLKKRLDNGSIGFQVSTVPRAPRSVRRSALHKKTASDKHVCAIELLASLAGKLLQETESSASNHASEDNDQLAHFKDVLGLKMLAEDKPLKVEGQGSCEESAFVSEQSEESKQKDPLKRSPEVDSDNLWECNSIFPGSPCSDKESSDAKSIIISNSETQLETSDKVESFPKNEVSVSESERQLSADHGGTGANVVANSFSLEDSAEKSVKVPTALGSDSQAQKVFCQEPSRNPFSTWQKGDAKLGRRDEDENISRFNKYSTKFKPFRRPQRALDRRIRKLLTSKHWKAAPQLKDYESPKIDGGRKSLNQKRRNREKYHWDFLYKRRKLLDGSSMMTSDGALSSESDTSSDYKNMNRDVGGSFAKTHGESGVPSSVLGNQTSFGAKNSLVKFSIKSFKIPELFVDVPETATVGSLKRTIVEAVTAILGGGLRVGVLLRGKKVRDDNRTLLQTGLSCKDNLDSLGFMLEPNLTQAPPIKASEDVPLVSSGDAPKILTRSAHPVSDTLISDSLSDPTNITNTVNNVDKNHDLIPSHTDILTDKPLSDSRALVPIPDTHPEPLAIVPVSQKSKRSELSQRRIRRPFSVSEVEALVQAVEELGTGRWRDVKLRAFENADHRTYVDLKDKWKTLVHTASISPQQRRGEPVLQELLDRVLAAHSYWSQHQAKQHGKLQAGTLKIADVPAHAIEVEGN